MNTLLRKIDGVPEPVTDSHVQAPDGAYYEMTRVEGGGRLSLGASADMTSSLSPYELRELGVDGWHERFSRIFRYFFRYPPNHRLLVHAFCAAVRGDWSSEVRSSSLPDNWNEQQSESGTYLLEYDAKLGEAVQYGREQPIAEQHPDFDKVDFAKIMSPAIDWDGMELTDPRDGTKTLFAPGELHLTDDADLQDQIASVVTRSDLIDHWNLTFS